MDESLGLGLLCALAAFWILHRIHRRQRRDVLRSPHRSCERNSTEAVPR